MAHFTGKAALFVLSIISASAYASHLSYEGEAAPEHWDELDGTYKTCQNGMNQLAVNIDSTTNALLSSPQTHYSDGPVTLTNIGHTLQAGEKAETHDKITQKLDLNKLLPINKTYWRFSAHPTALRRHHLDCPQTSSDPLCRATGEIHPYK